MRRDFLKWCAAAGLSLAAPISDPSTAWSQEPKGAGADDLPAYGGPFYLIINASGGWDTTYLMDPKGVNEINRLYQEGDILTQGSLRYAPTAKQMDKELAAQGQGLSNEAFFERYGAELLVVNGLDYSVNNHSPCSRYMATGNLDGLAYPTFAALAAGCRGPQCPLAFLTFGNYSGTGNLVPMSRVPYISSLKLLANADSVQGVARHPYHDDFVQNQIEQALSRQQSSRSEAMERAADKGGSAGRRSSPLPRRRRADNMLFAAQWNSQALSRVTPHVPEHIPKDPLSQQGEIALASFKAGVCVSANLTVGQFDSHQNNDEDQMRLIPRFLGSVDYLLQRAEELKIRDKLIVILQSEMGRTPTYNKGDGKDHWSIGSIMFLGPGIKGEPRHRRHRRAAIRRAAKPQNTADRRRNGRPCAARTHSHRAATASRHRTTPTERTISHEGRPAPPGSLGQKLVAEGNRKTEPSARDSLFELLASDDNRRE